MPKQPSEPVRVLPPATWKHSELYTHVKEAVRSLPLYFKTETIISGIMATDIFTLNATLGATIENQVVTTLNDMRPIWDPNDTYRLYAFVRQPQTFPDVLLRRLTPTEDAEAIVLGIELKGWYLLAKEGEPSFRFQATPAACNIQDLIVVVPWTLSNVISGSPRVFSPFVESARYAAEYRNYHWQYLRQTTANTGIVSPQGTAPYPKKSDKIADKPVSDSGGNFGRFARTGIMDEYLEYVKTQLLCGIEARYWLAFFKAFQEHTASEIIESELEKLTQRLKESNVSVDETALARVKTIVGEIEKLITHRD
jgi:hypothetical protein